MFNNTLWEIGQSTWEALKNNTITLCQTLVADWQVGHTAVEQDGQQMLGRISHYLKDYQTQENEVIACFIKQTQKEKTLPLGGDSILNDQGKLPMGSNDSNRIEKSISELPVSQSTKLPYTLTAGEWQDLLNATVSGGVNFFKTFTDQLYAIHPMLGLCFTLAYLAGGGAILAPHLVAWLGKDFILFSQTLGQAIAKGAASEAIAAGFTEAKLVTGLMEGLLHGPDSWLVKGWQTLERDPAEVLFYGSTAVGIGYLLTFLWHVPWLSEHLREDLGKVPMVTTGVAGGKVTVLLLELLKPHKGQRQVLHDKRLATIEEALREAHIVQYCRLHWKTADELTPLDQEIIAQGVQRVMSIIKDLLSFSLSNHPASSSTQTKTVATEELKAESDKLACLILLTSHLSRLSSLPPLYKYQLLNYVRKQFNPKVATALSTTLFPVKSYSILGTTIKMIADYPPLVVRGLASCVTWHAAPWRLLASKVSKDLTRVLHAGAYLMNGIASVTWHLFAMVGQVIGYNILARGESFIRGDKHTISTVGHQTSAWLNKQLANGSQAAHSLVKRVEAFNTASNEMVALEQAITQQAQRASGCYRQMIN